MLPLRFCPLLWVSNPNCISLTILGQNMFSTSTLYVCFCRRVVSADLAIGQLVPSGSHHGTSPHPWTLSCHPYILGVFFSFATLSRLRVRTRKSVGICFLNPRWVTIPWVLAPKNDNENFRVRWVNFLVCPPK